MKVCHMTSVHQQEDIRIFRKECVSLAADGHETCLVSCGHTYEKYGVSLIGIGERDSGKIGRMIKTAKRVYKVALSIDADIYHFHDPELLPYGLKLKRKGKRVIFDSHEDVPGQILDKKWIPGPLRRLVSKFYKRYETRAVRRLDAVVAATPSIAERFAGRAKQVVTVNNYPKLDDIAFQSKPFKEREKIIAYAGGLNEIRGKKVLEKAMETVDGRLVVACRHEVADEGHISYIGQKDREGVNDLYGSARAGVVIYQPAANHIDAQPIKLFELMAAGLPVVASDFPLWRSLIEGNSCGLCVDPRNAAAVSRACNELLNAPEEAQEMGLRGRKAVEEKYNWGSEEKKLIGLYRSI